MPHTARQIAFDVLLRTARGAFAGDLLDAASRDLDSREAGLASEIVFGCLRRQLELDFLLDHFAGKPSKLDLEVRVALRMGIYQLRHLDKIPRHAAVSESVDLVKRARKRSAAGFVNAVLRKTSRDPVEYPDRATALSCPEWLLAKWDAEIGDAESIARAFLVPPEKYFISERQQDIGSQSIIPLLEIQPGHTFLDLCAAPGNKTLQAVEAGARAIACDIHFHRIRQVPLALRVQLDGTAPLPFAKPFDRILVDAPCSGTGTLGRNPEIRWRVKPSDIKELHDKQVRLLRNALTLLKPDGLLVYSTCSLEREENEEVVAEAAKEMEVNTVRRIPGRDPGDGFFAAVIRSRSNQ